jgi:DNA helicase-2/ATP-dependent DNA helicase PcrA
MVNLSSLNPEQYAAVTQLHGPVMIIAGAGTGKTRVITYRMTHMLGSGIEGQHIVALTFTNKAAKEMRERLIELVGKRAKPVFIGTFHSFCLRILREFSSHLGMDPRFTLAATSDQLDLIRKALEEKGWQGLYKPEDLLARISSAKNALLLPHELGHGFQDKDPAVLAAVYDLYERQLKLNRVIDFDDCIFKTALLLKGNPELVRKLEQRWTHYLVDEFQDTNFAQLYILELLAGRHQNICVVGDDDQSIYSWRGAMVETLDRFETSFANTRLIKLEQNYRCSNVILNAANKVIRNNAGRKSKTLWSASQNEDPITLASHVDDVAEAKWISLKIFGLLGKGRRPRDIGILYRANKQSRAIELALRENNIPYKVFGGTSFFERKEVKDFLCYFRLSVNPNDRLAFWRVINTPARGIGLKTLERVEAKALEMDLSPFEVLHQGHVPLDAKQKAAAGHFTEVLKSIQSAPLSDPAELEERGTRMLKEFGLEDEIKIKTAHEGSRRRKLDALRRLPGWIRQLAENRIEEKGQLQLLDLLDQLSLDSESPEKDKGNDNYVSLMTIHGSKGLEWPVVFLCGLEEDQLPHKNSQGSELGLSEERRLFYVALTRAKEKLHLSYARERFSQFKKSSRKPSRFLEELPAEGLLSELDAEKREQVAAEDKKQTNIARLSALKSSLRSGFERKPGVSLPAGPKS